MSLRDQLKGTGVALITPFKKDMSVDFESIGKMIDFVVTQGVNYLVVLGTTAETPTLSKEEKKEILHYVFTHNEDNLPIVIGIGGNDTKEVAKELETLPIESATAILSASPYYNKPSQEGIYQHYKTIAQSTAKPIILYNVPARTGSNILPATSVRLANDVSNINGMKEASGNMHQCMQLLRDKPQDFMVVSGDDNLALAQIACGMDGVISVAANCFPRKFCEMITAALDNDWVLARSLNHKLLHGYELLFMENNPAGVKAVLAEAGLIENYLRLPLVPLSAGVHQQLQAYLPQLK